jgi:hypothetical protein
VIIIIDNTHISNIVVVILIIVSAAFT